MMAKASQSLRAVIGALLATVMVATCCALSGCGGAATAANADDMTKVWSVDQQYINSMLGEYRFTDAWENLSEDSYPESSDESKTAYLAAMKWSDADGVIHFNPLLTFASAKRFLGDEALAEFDIDDWHDLSDANGATNAGKNLYVALEEYILRDDVLVTTGLVDPSATNTGSSSEHGVVASEFAGISGNRAGWVIQTVDEAADDLIDGVQPTAQQLCRCGNPTYSGNPGLPTGPTDQDDPEPPLDPKSSEAQDYVNSPGSAPVTVTTPGENTPPAVDTKVTGGSNGTAPVEDSASKAPGSETGGLAPGAAPVDRSSTPPKEEPSTAPSAPPAASGEIESPF